MVPHSSFSKHTLNFFFFKFWSRRETGPTMVLFVSVLGISLVMNAASSWWEIHCTCTHKWIRPNARTHFSTVEIVVPGSGVYPRQGRSRTEKHRILSSFDYSHARLPRTLQPSLSQCICISRSKLRWRVSAWVGNFNFFFFFFFLFTAPILQKASWPHTVRPCSLGHWCW